MPDEGATVVATMRDAAAHRSNRGTARPRMRTPSAAVSRKRSIRLESRVGAGTCAARPSGAQSRALIGRWMSRESQIGGGGGIRTHGTVSRTAVFKTAALNHSATPPGSRSTRMHVRAFLRVRSQMADRRSQAVWQLVNGRAFSPSSLRSAICHLRQEIHIQRDLQPQATVVAQLFE